MANYMRKLRLDGHLVISPLSRQAEQRQHVEGISIWTKQAGMACGRFYMNTMAALSLWKREIYNKNVADPSIERKHSSRNNEERLVLFCFSF